ncbi:hypothetical protein GCM10023324_36560 [Streptomyces youssoufiensis]
MAGERAGQVVGAGGADGGGGVEAGPPGRVSCAVVARWYGRMTVVDRTPALRWNRSAGVSASVLRLGNNPDAEYAM